jgi:phage terminase large subunit-like protein
MVFGESGILACAPPDRRPHWSATRRQLTWPNGAVAQIYSASDPESLRGPQFDCAWLDELAKWKKPQQAWDMLQFALRLGSNPQQLVTTTPRNVATLKEILARDTTRCTHASTDANRAHLTKSFLQDVRANWSFAAGLSTVRPSSIWALWLWHRTAAQPLTITGLRRLKFQIGCG